MAALLHGDLEEMEKVAFRKRDDPRGRLFFERLIDSRNVKMVDALDRLAGRPRTLFVVVGAAHFVGERGLPALLTRKGYAVRQLARGDALP